MFRTLARGGLFILLTAIGLTAVLPASARAQDQESPAPSITGHVEAGYYVLVSEPGGQGTITIPTRSFDAEARNSFLLNVAHLAIAHEFSDQVSATIEFDAGSDAQVVSGGNLFDVQEAYLTYTSSGGFSLTVGKFVTYAGIEVWFNSLILVSGGSTLRRPLG